jgi:hypothetical protein
LFSTSFGSAGAVSDIGDARPTTASGFRVRLGDTPGQPPVSCADNRRGAGVDTPAGRRQSVEYDKQKAERNTGSKDSGASCSSPLLRNCGMNL